MSTAIYKRIVIALTALVLTLSAGMTIVSGQNTPASDNADTRAYDGLIHRFSGAGTKTLLDQASRYLKNGKKQEAMVLYLLEMNRSTHDLDSAALDEHVGAFISAGDIYYADGNYPSALSMYVKGLKISESVPSQPKLQIIYKKMGNVYALSEDYQKAIELYKRGLVAPQVYDGERYKTIQNIIGAYIYLDSIPQARRYYEMAATTPHTATAESDFMQDFTLALILGGEGKHGEAIDRFQTLAKRAVSERLDPRYESSCYEEISKCYLADNNYEKAVEYMERCRSNAEKHNQLHMFAESLKTLSTLYDRIGQTGRSLQLKSRYLEIKDSIFNVREFDNVRNQQFVYEMDKVNDQISELNEEMERREEVIGWQRTVIVVIVLALAIILGSLFMVYRQKHRLHQSYTSLYRINKESISEQERLGDINRRLRREVAEQKTSIEELTRRLEVSEKVKAPAPTQAAGKYSSSNLNDERRDALADAIADVMENTQDYCDPDFSLDTLAEKVGSNAKYVSQVINEVYGKNFNNYVNHFRIRTACTRLADPVNFGNLTIKAIGDSVGYKSPTSFINIFRKINGMTPSMYQKMALEDSSLSKE